MLFRSLKREQLHKIVSLQIKRLEKQLGQNHYKLTVSDRAIQAIANEGYDPAFGARPIKRVIQRRLQNAIATELLKRDSHDGGSIHVDFMDDAFQIKTLDS